MVSLERINDGVMIRCTEMANSSGTKIKPKVSNSMLHLTDRLQIISLTQDFCQMNRVPLISYAPSPYRIPLFNELNKQP